MSYDALDPFLTFSRQDPDMSPGDERAESKQLAERQGVIQDWLQGKTEEEHVLETLLDQGISPDHYIEVVEANIDYVIDQGIPFVSNDAGIFLPTRLLK